MTIPLPEDATEKTVTRHEPLARPTHVAASGQSHYSGAHNSVAGFDF
jgi:hypothetical protein